jgi:hypothetical protein
VIPRLACRTPADRSGAGYVDGDRVGVADDVPDGRVAGEAGELGELVVVEVAGGGDGDLARQVVRQRLGLDNGSKAGES